MAFHSHGEKKFEAQRVFTDREEPIALFETAFAAPHERDEHRVICWHGVGGQGKSSLHDEIRRRVAGNVDVALAGLDFDVPRHRRLEDAMLKLRGDLTCRGLSFPTFDLAFARHFALERPGENIREVYPQIYRKGESEIIDDIVDWSEATVDMAVAGASLAVPGLNLLYKYGARLTGRLGDWWASRAVKDKLVGLDQLSQSELAERLPQYLGFDIWRARTEIGCPRVVLTVDTHEKLGGGNLRGDAWLQTLVREMPGALILIFGRDKLRWAEIDERWTVVLDQHLLGALSDEDADSFLAQVPIPEDDIRARIVAASEGLPHYLDLSVSLYEDMANARETPTIENFGTTPAGVRERFLDHLPDAERLELFLAAFPESLSERLFLDLAEAFLGGAGNVNWTRLSRRSFMNEGPDGRLVMHSLMRDALQGQDQAERPEFFARVHEHLFEHYAGRARVPDPISVTPDAERALRAATFHVLRLGRQKLLDWSLTACIPFRSGARWLTLDNIYDSAISLFPEPSKARASLLISLANVRRAIGRNAEAEELYKQALPILRAEFGEMHITYQTALTALADVIQLMGRYADAEALCERALVIKKAKYGTTSPHYARTLTKLADIKQAMGRDPEVEDAYEQALAIFKDKFGERHASYQTTLTALAGAKQAMGHIADAEALYVRALVTARACFGDSHPAYGTAMRNLARARVAIGRYAEAVEILETVLTITKDGLGEVHRDYAATLCDLAEVRLAMGDNAEAEALFEKVVEIEMATLGEAHPDYATTLHSLANVRQRIGRHEEAETLHEQALAIHKAALGETHSHTILCLASLAGCKASLGKLDESRPMITLAVARAATLTDGADLWRGRVCLKWAQGLAHAGLKSEARDEARVAAELLKKSLGPEAAITREAQELLGNLEKV